MDEELIYPNPVARSDLPVQKSTWPYWVAGVTLAVIVGVAFLPQLVGSVLGRNVLKVYLGKRLNGEVNFYSIHTSWTGGTTLENFTYRNPDGHFLTARHFECQTSLGKLLRGKFELGDCVIDQPVIDWVVDYGDMLHCDTYSRFVNRAPLPQGAPPAKAPRVSGNVKLNDGVLNVIRVRVTQKTLQSTYSQFRVSGLQGTFAAKSLTDPWECTASGRIGDDKSQSGTITATGTLGCGGTAIFSPSNLQMSLKVEAANAPTGAVLSVLVPFFTSDDAVTAMGPKLRSFKLAMQGHDGKLKCNTLEVVGSNGQLSAQPDLDVTAYPSTATLTSPATFSFGVPSGDLRTELTQICPLLSAASVAGNAVVTLENGIIPMDADRWRFLSATGQLTLTSAKLISAKARTDEPPKGIVTQLSVISGDIELNPSLSFSRLTFTADKGRLSVGPGEMTVGQNTMLLSGQSGGDQSLAMTVAVTAGSKVTTMPAELTAQRIELPMVGTADAPQIDFDAARNSVPPAIKPSFEKYLNRQLALYRTHMNDNEKTSQQRAVEGLLKAFVPNE